MVDRDDPSSFRVTGFAPHRLAPRAWPQQLDPQAGERQVKLLQFHSDFWQRSVGSAAA